jgi:lysophospholipase L1-like esterase
MEERMLRSPWEWILVVAMVGGPLALRWRGVRGDRVFLLAWLALTCGSLYVLLAPGGAPLGAAVLALGLTLLAPILRLGPPGWLDRLMAGTSSPRGIAVMAALSLTLAPLAAAEVACRALTNVGLLRYHQPIETVWKSGQDDWRVATITADVHREPDPILLWRPVAARPYNSQRFKGPLVRTPKPSGVIRIFCYGDSLMDGPPRGDWPSRLQRLLDEHPPRPGLRFEVVNAGVAGYSSHQGMLRFLQEFDEYNSDLIIAGFGWNDVAQAVGPPDRAFQPPPGPIVAIQRAMIRYRAYLVLTAYLRTLIAEPAPDTTGRDNPRVSIPDYLANLDRFRSEAGARGVPVVFLTRPHRATTQALRENPTWRRHVPEYNAALVSWSRERGVPLIDAQAHFAEQPVELFSDECHFFPPGYQKLAELVLERLFQGREPVFQFQGDTPALLRNAASGPRRPRPVERTASSREP